jgi:preprotein translocase subunit YajC
MLADFEKSKKKQSPLMKGIEGDVMARQAEEQAMESPKSPFQAGEVVVLPGGEVGEVHDVKKDHALVNEDGKLHKVKLSDLQAPNETVVKTVSRLLEIPEIDKSSKISYWAYDPEDKNLFVMYHNGETYKYLDVDEDLENEILEAAVSPKTKGENQYGAWSEDDKLSRGATLSEKINNSPKYRKPRKGEPPNPFYQKLRKGYDYWQKLRT